MSKSHTISSLFCFGLLILGVVCLLLRLIELGIYCNTLVFALQSILIAQQVIRNKEEEDE